MQSTTDYLPYVRRLQAEHGKIRRVVRRIPTECFGAKARRSARPPKSVLTESLIVFRRHRVLCHDQITIVGLEGRADTSVARGLRGEGIEIHGRIIQHGLRQID